MTKYFHILNGDSLQQQFPTQIKGEIIVARECLVQGNVEGETLGELFEVRAKYISECYGDYSISDYYDATVTEFEKVQNIPKQSDINLWFEDDLFCQVNFWFTVYLIRPPIHTRYGFGGLTESELHAAYKRRSLIVEPDKITTLWTSYKKNDTDELIRIAKELEPLYPFIYKAVEAHIERIPDENNPGRPVQSLIEIMNESDTEEFGPIFREFCKREPIYGFGDLQVKQLFDQVKNNR